MIRIEFLYQISYLLKERRDIMKTLDEILNEQNKNHTILMSYVRTEAYLTDLLLLISDLSIQNISNETIANDQFTQKIKNALGYFAEYLFELSNKQRVLNVPLDDEVTNFIFKYKNHYYLLRQYLKHEKKFTQLSITTKPNYCYIKIPHKLFDADDVYKKERSS